MGSIRLKIAIIALIGVTIMSCTRNVTNNVPGANPSTPKSQPSGQTTAPNGQSEYGGVINGGGGKGVLCKKKDGQTLETLDLYEARTLYHLTLLNLGTSEETAKGKLAELLARHFWNPYNVEISLFTRYMKDSMIQEFLSNIRFIESGKKLKLVNDSFEPTLENGCESVQIAFYYDESVLLVDKALWEQLNWTNKMALIAHEALYFLARQSGTKNSMSTRKLVGLLFSTKGLRPLADGSPRDSKNFLDCKVESNGFSRGHFFMYPGQDQDGTKGIDLLFFDLGTDGSLFRTSAFATDLSFVQIQSPRFLGVREAALIKDTYLVRDRIRLNFKGIRDGSLKADLRILQGAGSSIAANFDVTCPLPADFSGLEPQDTEPGRFEQKHGDGSIDVLTINRNGSLILEQTRQLGGTGGVTNFGVAPYPTVCRYKEFGMILSQNDNEIQYMVTSGELGDLQGLRDTQHCTSYIDAFNREAADGSLRFTIRKSEFIKVQ
ncbi:MAG: hypothetical protein IPL83_15720 [Bdellovibrionales bacterium]|nr:hypothetical protein [Bdellovibrionales bacterium]